MILIITKLFRPVGLDLLSMAVFFQLDGAV
jgi:hypothetical protein